MTGQFDMFWLHIAQGGLQASEAETIIFSDYDDRDENSLFFIFFVCILIFEKNLNYLQLLTNKSTECSHNTEHSFRDSAGN